jgi:DNA-binding NarL/FixJ family response regulator
MSSEPNPVRIVIADGRPAFRQSIRKSLDSAGDIQITGEVSNSSDIVRLSRQFKPDVLVIDLALLPRPFELEMGNDLWSFLASSRIVAMVSAIEKTFVVEAFRWGAHGIVLRTAPPEVVLQSIRSVATGYYSLDHESVSLLLESVRESLGHGNGTTSPKAYGLTRRELGIITKIASGRSNREVGQEFSISERTVKHHLTNIFSKTGVTSRLQLALFAVNNHLMTSQTVLAELQTVQSEGDI